MSDMPASSRKMLPAVPPPLVACSDVPRRTVLLGASQAYGAQVGAPLLALLSGLLLVFTAAWGLLQTPAKYLPLTLVPSPRRLKRAVTPVSKGDEEKPQRPVAMVVVDPFSTGAVLAQMISDRGYQVVRVVSASFSEEIMHMLPAACSNLSFAATIQVTTNYPWHSTRASRPG